MLRPPAIVLPRRLLQVVGEHGVDLRLAFALHRIDESLPQGDGRRRQISERRRQRGWNELAELMLTRDQIRAWKIAQPDVKHHGFDARVPAQHEIGNAVIALVAHARAAAQVQIFQASEVAHDSVRAHAVKSRAVSDLYDVGRRIGEFTELAEDDGRVKSAEQIELGALDDIGPQRETKHRFGQGDDGESDRKGPQSRAERTHHAAPACFIPPSITRGRYSTANGSAGALKPAMSNRQRVLPFSSPSRAKPSFR